jgi:hypothetical protein
MLNKFDTSGVAGRGREARPLRPAEYKGWQNGRENEYF